MGDASVGEGACVRASVCREKFSEPVIDEKGCVSSTLRDLCFPNKHVIFVSFVCSTNIYM